MAQRASWGWKAQRCHCSPGCLPPSPGATVLLGLALQPLHSDDSHAHGYPFSDETERAETGECFCGSCCSSLGFLIVITLPFLCGIWTWEASKRRKRRGTPVWQFTLQLNYCVTVRLLSPRIETIRFQNRHKFHVPCSSSSKFAADKCHPNQPLLVNSS